MINGGIEWTGISLRSIETNETTTNSGYYLFPKLLDSRIRFEFEGELRAKSCNLKEYTSTRSTSKGLINECISGGASRGKKRGDVIFIGDRRTRILYHSWVGKFTSHRAIQDYDKRSMMVNAPFYFYWSEMFSSLVEIADEIRRTQSLRRGDGVAPQLIIIGEQFLASASHSKNVDFEDLEKTLEKIKNVFPESVVFLLGTEGVNDLKALQHEYRL